jgi:hypothetical protein
MARERHGNIGDKAHPELDPVEHRPVALDKAAPLHLLHTAQACRWGKTDALSEVKIRLPSIARKLSQYVFANGIKSGHGLRRSRY